MMGIVCHLSISFREGDRASTQSRLPPSGLCLTCSRSPSSTERSYSPWYWHQCWYHSGGVACSSPALVAPLSGIYSIR